MEPQLYFLLVNQTSLWEEWSWEAVENRWKVHICILWNLERIKWCYNWMYNFIISWLAGFAFVDYIYILRKREGFLFVCFFFPVKHLCTAWFILQPVHTKTDQGRAYAWHCGTELAWNCWKSSGRGDRLWWKLRAQHLESHLVAPSKEQQKPRSSRASGSQKHTWFPEAMVGTNSWIMAHWKATS